MNNKTSTTSLFANKSADKGENSAVETTEGCADGLTVRDGQSRRRFLRSGSAFLLATTALAAARPALADCDQNPEQHTRCSDNDEGASSDPTGCGRCGQKPEVPASLARDAYAEEPAVKRITMPKVIK